MRKDWPVNRQGCVIEVLACGVTDYRPALSSSV